MNHMRRKPLMLLLVVLAMIAAACGGDDAASGATDCEAGGTDGDLNFYNWSEYIDPELIEAFESEYDVDVVESFYESNEAMLSQINSGVSYDLIVPSDYMVGIMIQEDLLVELNKDALPNYSNLAADFQSLPYDPDGAFSVAYQYGTTGLGVNTAVVGEDFEPSWALIFDPELTSGFAGGVSVLNDPRETMGAALKYLGYSLNDSSLEHLQEAADLIAAAKAGISTFDSDQYDEALVGGEVAVAHGYSGNMIVAIGEADDPDSYQYVLPKEGATLWIDNMAIPVEAESPCTAHTFIDFLLDADNGAALTNWNYYGTPNGAALDQGLIEEEVVDFYSNTDDAEGLEVIQDTGDFEINFTDELARAKS